MNAVFLEYTMTGVNPLALIPEPMTYSMQTIYFQGLKRGTTRHIHNSNHYCDLEFMVTVPVLVVADANFLRYWQRLIGLSGLEVNS